MSTKRLNFSVLERDILLRLIEENIEIIESKKNDGFTVKRKDEAWARIVSRYNSEHDMVRRTHRQLRKYWNNLKMRAKKSMCTHGYTTITLPSSTTTTTTRRSTESASSSSLSKEPTPNSRAHRPSSTPVFPEAVQREDIPPLSAFQQQQQRRESEPDQHQPSSLVVEAGLADEETGLYTGRNNGEVGERDGDYQDALESDAGDMGEEFQWARDRDFRHETAERVVGDNNVHFIRNEREGKMALLAIQMETAHEQRELAREVREQTRQRHRLEMQVLEEKRRYRQMKMDALSLRGKAESMDKSPGARGSTSPAAMNEGDE